MIHLLFMFVACCEKVCCVGPFVELPAHTWVMSPYEPNALTLMAKIEA